MKAERAADLPISIDSAKRTTSMSLEHPLAGRRPVHQECARAFPAGDEVLVFSLGAGSVMFLNLSARAVWELCDGRNTVEQIAVRLSEMAGADSAKSAERFFPDVARSIQAFLDHGIVALADEESPAATPSDPVGSIQIGFEGYLVALEAENPDVLRSIAQHFRFLRRSGPGALISKLVIHETPNGMTVRIPGDSSERYGPLSECLRELERGAAMAFARARKDQLWLHAGAAATSDRALLVIGPSASGKSSLVTELCRRGWDYLSDETIPLDPATGQLFPYPTIPRVRETGQDVAAEEVYRLSRSEFELQPGSVRSHPALLTGIVLPFWEADAREELIRCSPAEAGLTLVQNCQNFQLLGEAAVRWISQVVSRVPAYRLRYSDRAAAADLLAAASPDLS